MNVIIRELQATRDLPSAGQQDGDMCYVKDTRHYWQWDTTAGIWQDLGTKQDLINAPNDRLGLKWKDE